MLPIGFTCGITALCILCYQLFSLHLAFTAVFLTKLLVTALELDIFNLVCVY